LPNGLYIPGMCVDNKTIGLWYTYDYGASSITIVSKAVFFNLVKVMYNQWDKSSINDRLNLLLVAGRDIGQKPHCFLCQRQPITALQYGSQFSQEMGQKIDSFSYQTQPINEL